VVAENTVGRLEDIRARSEDPEVKRLGHSHYLYAIRSLLIEDVPYLLELVDQYHSLCNQHLEQISFRNDQIEELEDRLEEAGERLMGRDI